VQNKKSCTSTLYETQIEYIRFLKNNITMTQLVNKLLSFIEPKGSFMCSQEHTSGPYPDSLVPVHIFNPYFFKINLNIIPSILRFPKYSSPFRFSK